MRTILTLVFTLVAAICSAQALNTVPYVDIKKYSGLWYEIAHLPIKFQKGCTNTTAEYTLTDENYLIVKNTCLRNGQEAAVKGKAFVVKNSGNAKLRVQFFWPFKADYWILALDDDYNYAVIGNESRKNMWILSRSPVLDNLILQSLLTEMKVKAFPVEELTFTAHENEK